MSRKGVVFPRPFCGAMSSEIRFEEGAGRRIYAEHVRIEDLQFEVMIDTGGLYLMLKPEIADDLRERLDSEGYDCEAKTITLRRVPVDGRIYRLPVTFLAEVGEDLHIQDLEVFFPNEESEWPDGTPNILGLEGALSKMFFAFDRLMMPEGRFYFGFEEEIHG